MTVKTIMSHQSTHREIVIHPIPIVMSPNIITDKHFFIDNLLCLISNACKYSDKDAMVDVKINLINQNELPTNKSTFNFYQKDINNNHNANDSHISLSFPKSVLVTIQDTGIGISEENKKNLFQPFGQAQRHAGGTGLGLYSLMKRMEGMLFAIL